MGQYGNQPDFGTIVSTVDLEEVILPSAIFIGEIIDPVTPATITVLPVGNTTEVTFTGLIGGTFMPIVVTKIVSITGIQIENILVYR
jgi:hypothetical protein